jgi:hypothetical protein
MTIIPGCPRRVEKTEPAPCMDPPTPKETAEWAAGETVRLLSNLSIGVSRLADAVERAAGAGERGR